jgi:hypothetical protein
MYELQWACAELVSASLVSSRLFGHLYVLNFIEQVRKSVKSESQKEVSDRFTFGLSVFANYCGH